MKRKDEQGIIARMVKLCRGLVFLALILTVRYSHYWPPYGGVNTSRPDAPHLARLANGDRWQPWGGRGAACPDWLDLGTQFVAFGSTWTCVDRGGKVKGSWVDFLTPHAHAGYGDFIEITFIGSQFDFDCDHTMQ
jgi:hypothetical protein